MSPAVSFLLCFGYCTATVIVYYANLAIYVVKDAVIAQVLC